MPVAKVSGMRSRVVLGHLVHTSDVLARWEEAQVAGVKAGAALVSGTGEILGQCSAYNTRLAASRSKQAGGGAAASGRPSRAQRRASQFDQYEKLALEPAEKLDPAKAWAQQQLHVHRSAGDRRWRTLAEPQYVPHPGRPNGRGRIHTDRLLEEGTVEAAYTAVPLKKVPVRVAKYDVQVREASLRAVQAMHAILSHMVVFTCNECKERFPTFHPAYVPPPSVLSEMELMKRGKDGLAACNLEVSRWDELPPFEAHDGLALSCSGTCLRCQMDMDEQVRPVAGEEGCGEVVLLRSAENHMDPCFRFPIDDLQEFFSHATPVETMLVALDHMQVSFATISTSGLRKFRRNTISFPQDLPAFARRHG